MNHLKFSTQIRAPREKVWNVLWNDITYRKWTSVFNEGSYAESDWNEGSKVKFLSPTGEGMYSRIDKKVPNEFMSFKHLGLIKEGKEQPQDEETQKWSGAMEDYRLKEINGLTELIVETDVTEDFQEFIEKTFPMALEKVKNLSEN
jgi:hypothetical protein